MPAPSTTGQPTAADAWFETVPGQALLDSEAEAVMAALGERPGQPWLWFGPGLAPLPAEGELRGPGVILAPREGGWSGPFRCSLPLPLASESVGAVVLQHPARAGRDAQAFLDECTRVLVPGAWLTLFCLNPLSPWRWRWGGGGPGASEPMPWRRRLRIAGLSPDPVSRGLGPRWRVVADGPVQHGPGLRAAWMLRAQKRLVPLTPVRGRTPVRIGGEATAA